MKPKMIDIISALLINVIVVILYFKFLAFHFGNIGLACAYIIAIGVSWYIYLLRKKEYLIDATVGILCIAAMIYVVMYKRSWHLFAMEVGIIIIVYSVSSFYFDWKKLDRR